MASRPARRPFVCTLAALAALGCADEREPINRVQANALAKAFFVGPDLASPADDPEFYMRSTVIDVGFGADGAGVVTGSPGNVMRVKWEITEDVLLARLTHELVEGADGKGHRRTNNGVVVAAYPIDSHFDIRRDYNAQTGEEINIIKENDDDRVWHVREYMRVDWSINLITSAYDFDLFSQTGLGGAVGYESINHYVNDPADPDAPVFDAAQGYFDVVNRVYAKPGTVQTGSGPYPTCMLIGDQGGTSPAGNCNPSEVKVRTSWLRVPDSDYQPRRPAGGAFYVSRYGYDNVYGMVDSRWHRLGMFFNLWQKSHVDVPCYTEATTPTNASPVRDGDADEHIDRPEELIIGGFDEDGEEEGKAPNGTDDECEAGGAPAGSRCDDLVRKCTLPYAQRTQRAHPFYYGADSPPELFEPVSQATADWDVAMRLAVQASRLTECKLSSGASAGLASAEACAEAFPMAREKVLEATSPIFFLCHSPVAEGDPEGCGPRGMKVRIGDVRYHHANIVSTSQLGSPWAFAADGADPLTGERIMMNIHFWDSSTKASAQHAVDVVRWMNGELRDYEVAYGVNVHQHAVTGDLKRKEFPMYRTLSGTEVERRVRALDRPAGLDALPEAKPVSFDILPEQLVSGGLSAAIKNLGQPVDSEPKVAARLAAARGSPLEAELTTTPWRQLAGLSATEPMTEERLHLASPLRGNHLDDLYHLEHTLGARLADRGICRQEMVEPTAFVGLSKIMERKFPIKWGTNAWNEKIVVETPGETFDRVNRMRDYLRKKLTYGIMLHEMGHSMGLRHNFTGSYDAMNFRPQYWQLRTNDGKTVQPCGGEVTDGSTCVGPRYHDPLTSEENDQLLWMWEYGSVMEYGGDITQDTLGLGDYDYAAIRQMYGNAVDVLDDGQKCELSWEGGVSCNDEKSWIVASALRQGSGSLAPPQLNASHDGSKPLHYSELQARMQLVRNCQPVPVEPPAGWNEVENGAWDPVLDGQIVNGTRCEGVPRAIAPARAMDWGFIERGTGRPRWPYMFGTDGQADGMFPSVMRHDNGADTYEQFNFWVNAYENRHLFDNFRRGRMTFSVRRAASGALSRYHAKMRSVMQSFALWHEWILRGYTLETGENWYSQFLNYDGRLRPMALATSLGFDEFTRMLTRPHAATHGTRKDFADNFYLVANEGLVTGSGTSLYLKEGSQRYGDGDYGFGARRVNNNFENVDGNFETTWFSAAGSYYDKVYSILHMTESSNKFLEYTLYDFTDGRFRNMNLATLYPDGFRRLVAAALTGDLSLLGARAAATGEALPEFVEENENHDDYPEYVPKRPLGWLSFWPRERPEVCWPSSRTLLCRDFVSGNPLDQTTPLYSIPVDPQIGIEIQKFIVFWSLANLPENWKTNWVEQFRIYSVGKDANPEMPMSDVLHFRDPESRTLYIANRFGTEEIFGKTYERGVAARMLAWANNLVRRAYELDPNQPEDPVTGEVHVVYENGMPKVKDGKQCADSPECFALQGYRALIDFTRQTAQTFGFPASQLK